MNPLPVVHIISALPVGGVEQNLLRVLPRLDPNRFRPCVVCLRERGELAAAMEAAGVPVHLVRLRTRYDPGSLWQLSRMLRTLEARVVHCHMRRANTSGRLAALLAGVPVRIATEHDMAVDKSWRHLQVDRLLAHLTDRIVAVTSAVARINGQRARIPAHKFCVIYHGCTLDPPRANLSPAEARRQLGLPAAGPLVGYVGRLHAIKNAEAIVRAFAEPPLAGASLVLVGDGAERERLVDLVQALDLSARVHLLGFRTREDLPLVYAALDALVLASTSEGFGLVLVEALAAGVPLVTTPVGVAGEALDAGREYVRVDRPAPDAIAAALAEALDPERAAELRQAGLAAAARFSLDAQVQALEGLYLECARHRGVV